MFTGIVEEVGRVAGLEAGRLTIAAATVMPGLKLGDSVAVNGACLTVVWRDQGTFAVDLAPETLRRTSLGELQDGQGVNLERALAVGDRLGGHIVQGHVDGYGRITSRRPEAGCIILGVTCPRRLMRYIVEKGFVAVDGMSLTVVKKRASSFTISVIPYTLANTNLREKSTGARVNARVNLEVDILAKYVESLVSQR